MLLPWTVGRVSQRLGVHMGMVVPGIGAIGITALSAIVMLRERQTRKLTNAGEIAS
jgi:hypothetical protein